MSVSASISTLSEFLLQAHTQFQVFDMGRGIRKVSNNTFFEWENQQAPCAFPRQNQAWFCIVFWNKSLSAQHYMWFIKLPLDESGLMIGASLQQFLDIITQALGKHLEHTGNSQAQLPENPYVFVPSQQQLADCNAHIRKELKIERVANEKAMAYLQAPNAIHDSKAWEALSLQDVADFVINPMLPAMLPAMQQDTQQDTQQNMRQDLHQDTLETLIANNLNAYPAPVLTCLLGSLESVEVGPTLTQALIRLHSASTDANLAALCLRAMSVKPQPECLRYVEQLIGLHNSARDAISTTQSNSSPSLETCVVIAGRYWQMLNNENTLGHFMHKLALIDDSHQLFKGLYADLVKIPETRNSMLRFMRQPQRTKEVSLAISALFAP
jgi:hypothetical protein